MPCNNRHLTVLLASGSRALVYGFNAYGQLGKGDNNCTEQIETLNLPTKFTAISVGQDHNVALTENGSLWVWGDNSLGMIH
jgi:alpha-tubulin suppressor-like RCC1 family protein